MKNIIMITIMSAGVLCADANLSKSKEIQSKKEILAKKETSPKVIETKEKVYPRGTIASH